MFWSNKNIKNLTIGRSNEYELFRFNEYLFLKILRNDGFFHFL